VKFNLTVVCYSYNNNNNNKNKFITYIALFTAIDQKRFTELRIDTIFTLLISYVVTDEYIKY
jgi:hypothetical protein